MTAERNHSIDVIKGWGILLVIVGHILLGSAEQNVIRYIIYSFHMPLFFFISGYLININKLGLLSAKEFLSKYIKKMLGWWFLAWLVFTPTVNLLMNGYVIADYDTVSHFIIRNLVYPWHHLWFIPALFIYIATAYFLYRYFNLNDKGLILAMLTISIIQMSFSYSGMITNLAPIRYHNLLFFTIGLICRTLSFSKLPPPIMPKGKLVNEYWFVFITYLMVILISRYWHTANQSMINFAALLFLIILGIAPIAVNNSALSSPLIEWMGRNSLHIYLWHELPIVIFLTSFKDNPMTYYIANMIFFVSAILIIWLCNRRIAKNNVLSSVSS